MKALVLDKTFPTKFAYKVDVRVQRFLRKGKNAHSRDEVSNRTIINLDW